jgi:hypothetical protein
MSWVFKTYFEDYVAEQVNNETPLSDLFRWQGLDYAGEEVVYAAHTGRNVSPMFVGEDAAFADATPQQGVKIRIGQRKLMGRVRMTWEAMNDTAKKESAFKSARMDEMQGLIKDLARRQEYALATDGRGVLALIDDATPNGAATMTVDAPGGIANDNFGNRFVWPGMFLAAVNPATGAIRAGISKVVSCASDGTSVTFDAACNAAWADNDYLVQAANASVTDILDTSYEHAFWGLMALIDDGTYRNNFFGVDRSVFGNYQSYVRAATGPLSEDAIQISSDVVAQKLGGKTSRIVTHHSTRRLYIQLTQSDRRYIGASLQNPDAGTRAMQQQDLEIGGITITAIRDFPLDVVMGIDERQSQFVEYGSEKGKWVDEDGSVLVRIGSGSTGRDAFEAWYRMRKQKHCRFPAYNWRLDGVTGQALVVVRAE